MARPINYKSPAFLAETINQLQELLGEELVDLMYEFFDDAREKVATITQAIANADTDTVLRTAHTLKSSSGNLGLIGISNISAALEHDARKGDSNNFTSLGQELVTQLERAKETVLCQS